MATARAGQRRGEQYLMEICVALHHKTIYEYDRLVTLSPQIVRLRPAPHSRTPISSYSLRVEPQEHFVNWQQDPLGNYLARLVFPNQTRRFSLEVDLVAEMAAINPFDFFLEPYAEKFPFRYETQEQRELRPFLELVPAGGRLKAFLASIDRREVPIMDFLVSLNCHVQREIRYEIRMEPGVQTPEETLKRAIGSCRDFGWLLVQTLRHLGLAARFVSGYLVQLRPDVKPLEGRTGPEKDFMGLHAWAEVYLPGAGWIGLDSTSGLLAGEGHIPIAAAPDSASTSPVSGRVSSCEVEFQHEMRVTRIQRGSFPTSSMTKK
jgi:transglutaminase-like putative cysteine protease